MSSWQGTSLGTTPCRRCNELPVGYPIGPVGFACWKEQSVLCTPLTFLMTNEFLVCGVPLCIRPGGFLSTLL